MTSHDTPREDPSDDADDPADFARFEEQFGDVDPGSGSDTPSTRPTGGDERPRMGFGPGPAARPGTPAGDADDRTDVFEALSQVLGPLPPEAREALQSMGLDRIDPSMISMVQAQMQAMMAPQGPGDDTFNSTVAADVARQQVQADGDPAISAATGADVEQVVQVANLWLDAVTDLAPARGGARALSRTAWVEASLPVWREATEPVAAGVGAAIESAMSSQTEALGDQPLPEELRAMLPPGMSADPAALMGQLRPMMRRMSSSMFGSQVGQAVGHLAGDVVSGTEVGLPLVPGDVVALLPANVAEFADGLSLDPGAVHLYLALREAARVRLFQAAPWLGPQLLRAVQDYARDIDLDTDAIERAVQGMNPGDPESMASLQDKLSGSMFRPEPSPAQRAALERLETLLALVEGWVDHVTDRAASPHLPGTDALGEAVRRRRASGGPAEKVFASLVGLDLRPRRLRDAANLWAALEAAGDHEFRDSGWAHPDVAPGSADLDDPLGYVERVRTYHAGDDLDSELASLLDGQDGADTEEGPDSPRRT